ncbi:MAG: V-type ATP synthase subunit E family protein [Methanocellales archaeon]|nr:V-type ATP synthase subunit E family protein [Methanocellales archaeon]MDD3292224.1 V-type ATP synthase subunit E family protein [Methanocellales archaeon]MDD5234790.1 V-type ATP synthase subunit E family protein [Methanocellales archaeon]MDD5484840.1 V-type ATP synthase subunit E family protein [Methanocellales archaeon]
MGIEEIKQKILADANERAKKIVEEAEKKVKPIVDEAEDKAKQIKKESKEKAESEAESKKKRILALARLEARKSLLAARHDMTEEAFVEAVNRLSGLDDGEYLAIVKGMFLSVDMPEGDVEVILSPNDKKRVSNKFLKDVEKELALKGKKVKLTLSKDTRDISGGFVLRKGRIEFNNSFDALIKTQRDAREAEIARILFGEDVWKPKRSANMPTQ